jgi:hypothetical protein
MTDQDHTTTPPEPAQSVCAVTLTLLPNGGGMGIHVHKGRVDREATAFDLESLAHSLTQHLQAAKVYNTFRAQATVQAQPAPPTKRPSISPGRIIPGIFKR